MTRPRRSAQMFTVTAEWVPTPEEAAAMFRESIPALARLIRGYREQQEVARRVREAKEAAETAASHSRCEPLLS